MKDDVLHSLDHRDVAIKHLGYPGRMLSGSKTSPPGETVFWNGNVFTEFVQKLWHGDINVTRDMAKLQALADDLACAIYVTRESPFRFEAVSIEKLDAIKVSPTK